MTKKISRHFYISGRVQGVWFRATTKEQADQLGLTGWVRNLIDGRVEVFACGEEEKIQQLHRWLQQGPKAAKVTDVQSEDTPWQDFSTFETR